MDMIVLAFGQAFYFRLGLHQTLDHGKSSSCDGQRLCGPSRPCMERWSHVVVNFWQLTATCLLYSYVRLLCSRNDPLGNESFVAASSSSAPLRPKATAPVEYSAHNRPITALDVCAEELL